MAFVPRALPRNSTYESQLKELIRSLLEGVDNMSELDYADLTAALHTLGFSTSRLDLTPGSTSDWQYLEFIVGYITCYRNTIIIGTYYTGTPVTAVGAYDVRRGELVYADASLNANNLVLPDASLEINENAICNVRIIDASNPINITDDGGNNVQGVLSLDIAPYGALSNITFKVVDGEWVIL